MIGDGLKYVFKPFPFTSETSSISIIDWVINTLPSVAPHRVHSHHHRPVRLRGKAFGLEWSRPVTEYAGNIYVDVMILPNLGIPWWQPGTSDAQEVSSIDVWVN
jgi:hypothetical protein